MVPDRLPLKLKQKGVALYFVQNSIENIEIIMIIVLCVMMQKILFYFLKKYLNREDKKTFHRLNRGQDNISFWNNLIRIFLIMQSDVQLFLFVNILYGQFRFTYFDVINLVASFLAEILVIVVVTIPLKLNNLSTLLL